MVRVRGDARLSREIVGGAKGYYAQRSIVAIQPVDDFVERTVAANRDDDIGTVLCAGTREPFGVSTLEGDADIDMMPALAYPVHHVSQIRATGAATVHDEHDVFWLDVVTRPQ